MIELSKQAKALLEEYRSLETLPATHKSELAHSLGERIARGDMPNFDVNVEPPQLPVTPPSALAPLTKALIGVGIIAGIAVPAALLIKGNSTPETVPQVSAPAVITAPVPPAPLEPPAAQPSAADTSSDIVQLDELPLLPEEDVRTKRPAGKATSPATIDEEVRLLKSAQLAINSGQAARALESLDEHAARFPRSKLADAREVTRMTALCNLGQKAKARELVKRFVQKNPASPFSDRVRRICE